MFDFQGQNVLITGATRGIGKRIADDFAGYGANLILTGTKKEQIETLNRQGSPDATHYRKYYTVDFTDIESINAFFTELEKYERIDVCINNAGINRINLIEDTKLEDWDDILAINLRAPFMIIQSISEKMKIHNYGRIVNIASIFGVISKARRSAYTASKFGLRGLTVTASTELAPYNILVNAVSPGFVLTELTTRILSKEEMEQLAEQVPMKRFAQPEEISKVVLFLASSINTYLTGQNIIVDGGFVNV